MALLQMLLYRIQWRAVIIFGIAGVFQKTVVGDQLLKPFLGQEVVVHTVHLTLAGCAGGGGNGIVKIALFEKFLQHRSLTHTGGAGDNEGLTSCHMFHFSFLLHKILCLQAQRLIE